MAAPLNVDWLLAPITADEPAGAWLRYDGAYDRIRDARREDDPSLPQGVWERSLKLADYQATAALCAEALELRSKDLQIAAWLSDAWAQLHGLAGIRLGLELVGRLCDRFWETMYPALEDDDTPRDRILEWLDEALTRRAHTAALGDARATLTLEDWERTGAPPRPDDEAAITRESLLARMSMVGPAHWTTLSEEVKEMRRALGALDRALSAHASEPTRLRRTDVALGRLEAFLDKALHLSGGAPTSRSMAAGEARLDLSPPQHAREGGPNGHLDTLLTSRADAYRRLTEAADYLLRTEPHSPVPYLVKRAIGWGNMSLAELLQEIVTSADDLVLVQRLLGMRRGDE